MVDANNAVEVPSLQAVNIGDRASSEVVAKWARVVKAFNHLEALLLYADPQVDGRRRVLFVAGEDADAKNSVSNLIARMGFAPVDLEGLNESRLMQFPGSPLAILNLVKFY